MRNAFAQEVLAAARRDERVVLLSGDIGNRLFDELKAEFPERFYNCGVAEANMMSVAAGLAMSGLRPIVYTITPFVTTRCLEQIRVDVCYHRQPVIIAGAGAGLSYASLGGTHHSCEDIGCVRMLPEMTVVCPGDAAEVRGAVRAALTCDGPVYIRLGKKGEPVVHESEPDFVLGRSLTIREGDDVALLAVGNVLPFVRDAAEMLAGRGVSARVDSFHTVKPLDETCLAEVFGRYALVVTVEEHGVAGGAGSAVAEWLAARPRSGVRLLAIGTPDAFLHEAGSQAHARRVFGLTPEAICAAVHAAWLEARGPRITGEARSRG
jgi:transketolase